MRGDSGGDAIGVAMGVQIGDSEMGIAATLSTDAAATDVCGGCDSALACCCCNKAAAVGATLNLDALGAEGAA